MKYKILVNGSNSALVTDFMQQTEAFFDTLSTSDCRQDILGHFKYFDPDAFVCFVEADFEKTTSRLKSLKSSGCYNGAAIVLIGDGDTCDQIEDVSKYSADLLIRRPITPDNLTLRIVRYFDDVKDAEEKAKEIAAKAAARKIEAEVSKIVNAEKKKKNILIVDDDRTVLKMLKSALSDKYEVTTMINGVMVEKFIEAKNVDLIILDYEMPIETGADVFKRIKKNPKAAHIPVCFLTGVSDREKIMDVMALKPHGYLLKPIDMNMLTITIKNLID